MSNGLSWKARVFA